MRVAHAEDIATARHLLAGEAAPHIPNGRVVRGDADVNVGYPWHIDPLRLSLPTRPRKYETGALRTSSAERSRPTGTVLSRLKRLGSTKESVTYYQYKISPLLLTIASALFWPDSSTSFQTG